MSIAADAVGTCTDHATPGTSLTYSGLTVGSSLTNSAALFAVWLPALAITSPSATWGSQTCSLILNSNVNSTGHIVLFGLVNPTSGNQTFTASWTNTSVWAVGGMSFTGVDQTGGTTSFPNAAGNGTNSGLTVSQSITTTSSDWTFGVYNSSDDLATTPFSSSPAGTRRFFNDDTNNGLYFTTSLTSQSTGTSTTYTGNVTIAGILAIGGCSIKAAGGGGSTVVPKPRPGLVYRRF